MNRWPLFLCLASTLALAQAAEKPAGPQPKLAVVPFAALSGDVPTRAGLKAAGMLSTEFKSSEAVQLVELKKDKANDPFAASIETARKAVEEAKTLRSQKKFRLADEALGRAVAAYRFAAGGVTDIGEVVDALALQAAVQFNTGKDDEGQKNLTTALALAPSRELPLAATSQLFAKVVADIRKTVQEAQKGSMLLESTPSGAAAFVDGVPLGSTPLMVREVPPGLHYWRILLPSGEQLGGAAEVTNAKTTKVTASSSTKDPESRLLSQLALNKLDGDVVSAAKEAAGQVQADMLVFGALSKEGKGLTLDSFFYSASANEVRRLPRTTFDTELLSAGMEFYNLAGQMASKGPKAGESVRLPTPVSPTFGSSGKKVVEARYGEKPGQETAMDGAGTDVKDEGARKPLEKRSPLKKK
jgi:hypothetical protein